MYVFFIAADTSYSSCLQCCGQNEAPTSHNCYNDNTRRSCLNFLNPTRPKNSKLACRKANCDCKQGFYRNFAGVCVQAEKCYDPNQTYSYEHRYCPGQNEQLYDCLPSIPRTCANRRETRKQKNDEQDDSQCCIYGSCDCQTDFYRNECGVCVEGYKCDRKCDNSTITLCGPNEEYVKEYNSCQENRCKGVGCIQTFAPTDGCQCQSGYYCNDCGQCIQREFCSTTCECIDPCPNKFEQYVVVNNCTRSKCPPFGKILIKCPDVGSYECDCINGYARNFAGLCRNISSFCPNYHFG